MTGGYPIPAENLEVETVVRKSRFIARALRIVSRSDALREVELVRQQYPDARHYCWAYLVGNPESSASAGMNDDGEPSGTAGKPILNVIQHKKIGDVLVVVVRYFGGIKLGAGGLTRAYSGAAEAVLSRLDLKLFEDVTEYTLGMPFAQEQFVRHLLGQCEATILDVEYVEIVRMQVAVPFSQVDDFVAQMQANRISVSAVS